MVLLCLIAPFGSSIGGLIKPKLESFEILHTTPSTISLQATVNFTNPTPYSASIPYVDCLMLFNGTALAHVTVRELSVVPGDNSGVVFEALWSPLAAGGDAGVIAGRDLLSGYVSGIFFSPEIPCPGLIAKHHSQASIPQ